jgi:hypothetical protein
MHPGIAIVIASLALALCACHSSGGGSGGDAGTDAPDAAEPDVEDDGRDAAEETPTPVAPPVLELAHDGVSLTPVAGDALALAPDWLQDDLALTLDALRTSHQNEMAGLLLDLDEPDLRDEVAFVIAHTSPEVLEHSSFFSELIVLNARLVAEHDELLDYVRREDVGVPGVDPDFHTTLTYQVETPAGREERTIDPGTYYWYVVHPRLEDELPWYVDGWSSGDDTRPDLGWFWRDFLWDAAAEGCPAARTCPLLSEQLPGIEVVRRLEEDSAYDVDAREQVYGFVEQVLDFGAGEERPTQPNRIYAVACGNCGEYADLTVAALRTALVPARNAGASSNDHTWAEWSDEDGGWHGETGFYKNGIRRDRRDSDCDGLADDLLDEGDEDGDGWTVAGGDCDDTRAAAHPGATETPNCLDDDCDGVADEGFEDSALDCDADGYSIADGDCDDTDAGAHPGAAEEDDLGDDDCDGVADDGTDTADADGDGHSIADGDCDDDRASAFPGTPETSNGRDDDCDGVADEGFDTHDRDGDGFSVADGDCDDIRAAAHPGADDPFLSDNRLYAITTARGDSLLGTDRTEAYATLPATLFFDVTAMDDRGVDGALVTVYGTWAVYGHPEQWAMASELVTGLDGHAEITVGEYNPYGFAIFSEIGDTPGAGSLFVATSWLEPYQTQAVDRTVPGTMPGHAAASEADLVADAPADVVLSVAMTVESVRIAADGKLFGTSRSERDGGRLDAYLVDAAGYAAYLAGEPFEAQWLATGGSAIDESFDLPLDREWVLLLANDAFTRSTMVGSVDVAAAPPAGVTWSTAAPSLDHRFRIGPGEHVAVELSP